MIWQVFRASIKQFIRVVRIAVCNAGYLHQFHVFSLSFFSVHSVGMEYFCYGYPNSYELLPFSAISWPECVSHGKGGFVVVGAFFDCRPDASRKRPHFYQT